MKRDRDLMLYGVIALAALYVMTRPREVGAAVVGAAGEAVAGGVEEVGTWFGIPRTNEALCEAALSEGRWFDASKFCTAQRLIQAGWN